MAAFAVLLSHLEFLGADPGSPAAWIYETLFRQGYCGVSFFYILSGFILSHAYGARLATGKPRMRSYFLWRVCRIAPLHWIMTLFFLAWLATAKGAVPGPGTIGLNFLLLHAWSPDTTVHYALNGPSWSLSDELFFYAAFPWLSRVPTRLLALCLVLGLMLVTALAVMAMMWEPVYSPRLEWLFYVAPPVRLADFVTGMLLYRTWQQGGGRRWAGTTAELCVTLAIPAAMVGFSLLALPMPLRWQLAYLPLMAAAVLVFAHGRGAISVLLQGHWPVLLGEASFALYLTHRPLVTLAARLWGGDPAFAPVLAAMLPPVCITLSIVIFLLFERPLLRRLRRRLRPGGKTNDPAGGALKAWQPS
ncbi:hypothetical protein V474_15740 [Novosphingobium barchaimii LL02]|uniref:Acyltransferase 3 domain-containing protein n=1 Tax=Novosphingobium barchaimii LL02 TaxID=1114963 RepID=A0A0J7XYC2_9SPHN|nr:hypothetical protein V474_15740 [Novosphingobium barchaimii LL02]